MAVTPQPGDFGLASIHGAKGAFVTLGQTLIGDSSRYTHAFVVVSPTMIVEARPGGAGYAPLSHWPKAVFSSKHLELTDQQREDIVRNAIAVVGTGYSFLDYVALGLDHAGLRPKGLREYIATHGHMICSQLVDYVYCKAGVHLFDDGRDHQDVSPGDLANLLLSL